MSNTIIPRPAIKPVIIVILDLDTRKELTEHEKAELEANLNDRFLEPLRMGEISLTFRSSVTQQLVHDVIIKTTSSLMFDDVLEEIIDITENTLDINIKGWQIDTDIQRKSFDDVDVQQRME